MKKTCNECHGTGQICYFKGESRFVLSRDECPACCGLGFMETDGEDGDELREQDEDQASATRKTPSPGSRCTPIGSLARETAHMTIHWPGECPA